MTKLCVDCKWIHLDVSNGFAPKCANPSLMTIAPAKMDYVGGGHTPEKAKMWYCETQRNHDIVATFLVGWCGAIARYWEPKE